MEDGILKYACEKCGGNHPTDSCSLQEKKLKDLSDDIVKEGEVGMNEKSIEQKLEEKKIDLIECVEGTLPFLEATLMEDGDIGILFRILNSVNEDFGQDLHKTRFGVELPGMLDDLGVLKIKAVEASHQIGETVRYLKENINNKNAFSRLSQEIDQVVDYILIPIRTKVDDIRLIGQRIGRLSERLYEDYPDIAEQLMIRGRQFSSTCDQILDNIRISQEKWQKVVESFEEVSRLIEISARKK